MKKLLILTAMSALMISCTHRVYIVHKPKKIPPGHAKKMTGSKSAKPYAPGQNKH